MIKLVETQRKNADSGYCTQTHMCSKDRTHKSNIRILGHFFLKGLVSIATVNRLFVFFSNVTFSKDTG